MKKNLFLLLIAIIAISCTQKEEKDVLLSGNVEGVEAGTVYLQKFRNKSYYVIDSSQIVDGEFSFSKDVELPEIYGLSLDTTKGSFLLFLDENPTTVVLDSANYYRNTKVEGSELHNLFVEYKSNRNVEIDSFIKQHPASLVSAYALYRDYSYRLTPEQIRSNIDLLDPSLRNTPYVETLEELIPTLEEVAVGNEAPNFTATDTEGNSVEFADHIGKSKYVFLDFGLRGADLVEEKS